jgi:hypothetical protein
MTGNCVKPQKTREQIEDELLEEIHKAQVEWRAAAQEHREAARERFAEALHVFNKLITQDEPSGNSE